MQRIADFGVTSLAEPTPIRTWGRPRAPLEGARSRALPRCTQGGWAPDVRRAPCTDWHRGASGAKDARLVSWQPSKGNRAKRSVSASRRQRFTQSAAARATGEGEK